MLPRAHQTSISAARADSRNGASAIAVRAARSASAARRRRAGARRAISSSASTRSSSRSLRGPSSHGASSRGSRPRLGQRRRPPARRRRRGRRAAHRELLGDRLDVDPDRLGEDEPQRVAALEHGRLDARRRRESTGRERGVARRRALVRPQRLDQLVAAHRPVAVQDQEREREPALAAAQLRLTALAGELHAELAAEMDATNDRSLIAGNLPPGDVSGKDLGERGLELGLDALLGHGALDALGLLAVAEEDHRRDREDLVLRGGLLVVVDVELDDAQVVARLGDLLRAGAMTRHGPHQGAQKSTSTGMSFSSTSAWKLLSLTSVMFSAIGSSRGVASESIAGW